MNDEKTKMDESKDRARLFLDMLTPIQPRLYGYIRTLVSDWSDVDDILQETASVMWSKFDEYEPGTDFIAWAFRITYYQVMSFYGKRKKWERQFSTEAVAVITKAMMSPDPNSDRRLEALRQCITKLCEKDRNLLHLRYEIGATAKSVSQRVGQNINTLYKNLNRIHILLFHCIQRVMRGEA